MEGNGDVESALTSLVDVVVLVLVDVCAEMGGWSLDLTNLGGVGVSGALLVQLSLVIRIHVRLPARQQNLFNKQRTTYLVLLDNSRGDRCNMLGLENTLVLDRLDSVLVVVDVSLTVDSLNGLDVLLGTNVLLCDLGGDLGADLASQRRPGMSTIALTSVESGLWADFRKSLTPWVIAAILIKVGVGGVGEVV
jgi:hypothetical protein